MTSRIPKVTSKLAWTRFVFALGLIVMLGSQSGVAQTEQSDNPLLKRWVGTHRGRPLFLEFYGDSMLVLDDGYVLDYYTTRDSIVAYGDTSFTVNYWFALGRLLLRTMDGNVITMSGQSALARPITGQWVGTPSGRDREVELQMLRDGTARWRYVPGGGWVQGEWDRFSRNLTFTWLPDSTKWQGQYEPEGNALLFENSAPGWGLLILRRFFRR